MTTNEDVRAWLGDFAEDATPEQVNTLIGLFDAIAARYPDRDDTDDRDAALSGVTQVVLGDDTLEAIAAQWRAAKVAERSAMAALTGALLASEGSERELERRAGVARMTVRKALGR